MDTLLSSSRRDGQPWPPIRILTACLAVSVGAVAYGLYRGYYALGGTAGQFGAPASPTQWLALNAFAAVALLAAAAVPLLTCVLWRWRAARVTLLVLFSMAAVGLAMHALTDEIQRALSLTGLAARWHVALPADSMAGWRWKDQRAADLQDALLNEPWFLAEGILCGCLVRLALENPRRRRWWTVAAVLAVLGMTAYGVLTSVGAVSRAIVF